MKMERIIAACGNDCSKCPRHLPKTEKELKETAELWFKIGYRDKVVSNDEIACEGCTKDNWCRYKIINCTSERGIENCGKCRSYPCEVIKEAFKVTMEFEPSVKSACSDEEYEMMKEAFFEKEKNLNIIKK